MQIAIDGPVAAGKSTVAKRLAQRLEFLYIDTGAMYRAVTLMAERGEIPMDDEAALVDLIGRIEIEVRMPTDDERDGRLSTVLVDGEDVSHAIRRGSVNRDVSKVAALALVREALVPLQQEIAKGQSVVMEGRDITYHVLPQATLRIFLTAPEEVRIERYYHSRSARERGLDKAEVAGWLKERDYQDWHRKASPLRITEGVWQLDTRDMNVEEVVEAIIRRVGKLE